MQRSTAITGATSSASLQQCASRTITLKKPLCDRRSYQHSQLPNGVRVLVLQDTEAIYAAACANVQCGYFDDNPDIPGTAHFLEHVVHLGSAKFPDEKDYKQFLSQHGGSSNASTSMVHTRYHFKVHSSALPGALLRLGAALSCPLIAPDSAAREVENVHSEYARNTNSDARKLLQLRRSLCLPPYSTFSTGSIDTLWRVPVSAGLDVPEVLRGLWRRWYRAESVCVAVVGPQPTEELLQWVEEAFGDMQSFSSTTTTVTSAVTPSSCTTSSAEDGTGISDKGETATAPSTQQQQQQQAAAAAEPPGVGGSTCQTAAAAARYPVNVVGDRGLLVYVSPERELRELELNWFIPVGVMGHTSVKPWQWASHLLGHEGPGSIACLLKAQGLVQSLEVGMGDEVRLGRGWMFWRVTVQLSQAGEQAVEHVVATIFRGIQVLERCSDEQLQQTWDEAAELAALRFNWQDPPEPLAAAQSAAYSLHYYPPTDVLSGPRLMTSCQLDVLRWFLQQLSPANLNIFWSSRRHRQAVNSTEKWYGARYAVQQLPQEWLHRIDRYNAVDVEAAGGCVAAGGALPAAPAATNTSSSSSSSRASGDVDATSGLPGLQLKHGELHLPMPNWALPRDLVLRQQQEGHAAAAAAPELLSDSQGLCVWHKLDTSFGLPKVLLRLFLISPAVYCSPEAAVATRLLRLVLEDVLLPQTYPAELAGSTYSISIEQGGLLIKITGFPGVAQQLLGMVLQGLSELTLQQVQDRFLVMQGRLLQSLNNWANNHPAQHAQYAANHLLQQQHHHNSELLAAAAAAVPGQVMQLQQLLASGQDMHVDMLAYGNISRVEVDQLTQQLQQHLQPQGLRVLSRDAWPAAGRVLCLSAVFSAATAAAETSAASGGGGGGGGEQQASWSAVPHSQDAASTPGNQSLNATAVLPTVDKLQHTADNSSSSAYITYVPDNPNAASNSNNAVVYLIQLGPDAVVTATLLDLFVQLSSKAAFHELRTRQRLGYSVNLGSSSLHRQLSLTIKVQSPTASPDAVVAASRKWLTSFRSELEQLSYDKLADAKKALQGKYLDPPKSLHEAARRAWLPIQSRSLAFDRRQHKADAAQRLTQEQLLRFYDTYVSPEGHQHRALCVHIWGGAKRATEALVPAGRQGLSVILPHQLQHFKQAQPLSPQPDMVLPGDL